MIKGRQIEKLENSSIKFENNLKSKDDIPKIKDSSKKNKKYIRKFIMKIYIYVKG